MVDGLSDSSTTIASTLYSQRTLLNTDTSRTVVSSTLETKMNRHKMDNNLRIILQTARELAEDYGKEGWTGDCNDFTQASSSVSQELTNLEVERLWDEFPNQEFIANGIIFTFTRQGRDKVIKLEQVDKN